MRWNVLFGTTLTTLCVMAQTVAAQERPPGDPSLPPSPDQAPANPSPAEQPPAAAPTPTQEAPSGAPSAAPADNGGGGADSTGIVAEVNGGDGQVDFVADEKPTKIGEKLSPLIVTAGLGYAYAAISHPELDSRSLSGAFLEVTAGTELDQRFRLSLAFSSLETKIRRNAAGHWEEGEFHPKVATSGTRMQAGPTGDTGSAGGGGGVEVQKTFHAHALGPRVDFYPLGSQGPYLGMTAGVGMIQDISFRFGADLAARIGADWRPFQALSLGIEAGAHGQIYDDSKAAIPYATARLNLLLEPGGLTSGSGRPQNPIMTPRTLPNQPQR